MEKQYYCYECNTERSTTVIEKSQTLNVKGRNITITVPVRVCSTCGSEILDRELDNKTLEIFYDEYRRVENLLSPTEIKNIRNKYSLSQASFAKLLGFGEKTITRYENGAIQDACHDNLIRLMGSLDSFVIIWEERKHLLTPREQSTIDQKLTAYNKLKVKTSYTTIPQYYTNSPIMYITKGDMSYAS